MKLDVGFLAGFPDPQVAFIVAHDMFRPKCVGIHIGDAGKTIEDLKFIR